jgi:hypothetical protein
MPGIKADFGGGGLGKYESKLDELAELLGASKAGSITVIDIVRMYTGSERSWERSKLARLSLLIPNTLVVHGPLATRRTSLKVTFC